MNKLITVCMTDEPFLVPPEEEEKGQRVQEAFAGAGASSHIGPSTLYNNDNNTMTGCLFCGENDLPTEISRRRHVERHMEEVAFAVVSKSYEEWEFYSDSSSSSDNQSP